MSPNNIMNLVLNSDSLDGMKNSPAIGGPGTSREDSGSRMGNRKRRYRRRPSGKDALLVKYANVKCHGTIKGNYTSLMIAVKEGHIDVVQALIKNGAIIDAQSNAGDTPLMYGCAGGHKKIVRILLEAGANIEHHNKNGYTPLMKAASAGHVQIAALLLDYGANINSDSDEFKESALTLACYKGHSQMIRLLMDVGADEEHKTDEMHIALMEASMDVEVAPIAFTFRRSSFANRQFRVTIDISSLRHVDLVAFDRAWS